ncbi:MAG: rod shape-determining protein RodA [Coriobacteriales bacterium]|jgi:rod shape determining protein RodA|nr:rod shape-determining protein RodA [Coriobacteriales bacterium]
MPMQVRMESLQGPSETRAIRDVVRRILAVTHLPLLLVAAVLTAYGLLVVSSAIADSELYSISRQFLGVGLGLVVMVALWRVDYHRYALFVVPLLIFDFVLLLLPLLPFIGVTVNGARSWISVFGIQVQPAEIAKILTIVVMAALVSRYRGKLTSGKEYLKCLALLLALLPAILLQPDLGTGLVFFAIGMAILFAGGANWKWLALTVLGIVVAIVLVLQLELLEDYQRDRLLVFINEDIDPGGIGYNLKQAKIAIGSGGLFGKGLGQATQSSLGFLPEAGTDFIFCVLAEEFGFVGCVTLLALYASLIVCSFWIALKADDPFGTLIVMGCVGMWVFQILENIGMDCGLMPITGIPLPFVSYGSSFMVANFMALGLLLSVWAHRSGRKAGDRRWLFSNR